MAKLNRMEVKQKFLAYIDALQDTITAALEAEDGAAVFKEDLWERPGGGGGKSRILENGSVFEKAGVNVSSVHGELPNSLKSYFQVKEADFFACGLSLVVHPENPMVPTVHANWRYFELYDNSGKLVDQWFGGGLDLTPYYLFEADVIHFHSVCKTRCDRHHPEFYWAYKEKCDRYFYNHHRGEARGVGGLFFDYLRPTKAMSVSSWYNFVTDIGNGFLDAYLPIVQKRKGLAYHEDQRRWQEIRRGRYVEFNLVHDRGTLFGLKTQGRIESILMSLPPVVQWKYNYTPEPGSAEAQLLHVLRNPREWISMNSPLT